jgi:antitoxin HicB
VEGLGAPDYFDELLERIRDIRASEHRMCLRVKEIFALAADYEASAPESVKFFQIMQNKLHFAANQPGLNKEDFRLREASMRTFVYPARFEPGERPGGLVVTFRDIPEAITQGKGGKDALRRAADCLEEAIAGRIADGREIPKSSRPARGEQPIPLAAPMAAKAALHLAMREAQTNNAALARKLGCDEKEVQRMLDPRHPTKLPRIEEALAALGRRLVMSVEEAA